MISDQQLNSKLLHYGADTSGSFDQKLQRLIRFMRYVPNKSRDAQITAELNQRGKFNQSERSREWALPYLRNYKTETFKQEDISTLNADYDYCVRERGGTVYYVQAKPHVLLSS